MMMIIIIVLRVQYLERAARPTKGPHKLLRVDFNMHESLKNVPVGGVSPSTIPDLDCIILSCKSQPRSTMVSCNALYEKKQNI